MPRSATITQEAFGSGWYLDAMQRLVEVVQELSQARSVNEVTAIVREAARNLTGADGATFVLRDGDQCYYAEENAIAPLWKGRRFPMSSCISGWVMLNARPAVIEDIYADPRVPADAYRPTFVKSLAMVPIRRSAPVGAIGNYWRSRRLPAPEEIAVLQALADTTSVALENADLYARLREQVHVLQEQGARIQEQHETLEVFTRALAHDLKEPVRTMTSFSSLILEGRGDPEETEGYLRFIRNAAERMSTLVDSVLRYVQIDDPANVTAERCLLQPVLESVKENLAQLIRERGAVIESGELPAVEADPVHMMQILQNLIANAVRHNEDGVTVHVRAEEQSNGWLFSVRDDGRGMSAEDARRVFLPFKRLSNREQSAGLGLAICDKIVSRCGGSIWCESRPGEGATFFFTMPGTSGAQPETRSTTCASSTALQPRCSGEDQPLACILLVDDRPDDMTLSRLMLSEQKLLCRVLAAQDGEEALAVLTREAVDLVLLDINMPGMDGFEVLERMRQRSLERLNVIMCTGSTYEKDMERARSLGAMGYLVKPPSFEELKAMLDCLPTLHLKRDEGGYKLLRVEGATCNEGHPPWLAGDER